MSIAVRMAFDNLIDEKIRQEKGLYFSITDSKNLCIRGVCGELIVFFKDIQFSRKEPSKKEIDYALSIVKDKMKKINEKIIEKIELYEKFKELENYRAFETNWGVHIFPEYFSKNGIDLRVYFNKIDSDEIVKRIEIEGKYDDVMNLDKKEVDEKIKEYIKKHKEYLEIKKEIKKLDKELGLVC